jgi:SAM-dependent methyltransferase
MFASPMPSDKELLKIYDASYFDRGNKYSPPGDSTDPNMLNDEMKIKLVQEYVSSGRLLDVGCALGGFLQTARAKGFNVSGVEPSKCAADNASCKLGIEVANCDLKSAGLTEGSFDVITMWDSLEHLRNPNETLMEAWRLLKKDGLLFFSTGDASTPWARLTGRGWHLLTPPQHLYYYSPASISVLLEKSGFAYVESRHAGKYATLDFISFKAREAFGGFLSPIRMLIHVMKIHNLRVYLNLFDIITCVARKQCR